MPGIHIIYQTETGTTKHEIPLHIRRTRTVAHGDIIVTSDGRAFELYTKRWFWAGDEE